MYEEKLLNLYTFLPEAEKISQRQNEQDWMRMMNLLKESILRQHPELKFKEMSQQEEV